MLKSHTTLVDRVKSTIQNTFTTYQVLKNATEEELKAANTKEMILALSKIKTGNVPPTKGEVTEIWLNSLFKKI